MKQQNKLKTLVVSINREDFFKMNNLTTSFFYPNQRISLNNPSMALSRVVFLKFSFSSFCFPFGVKVDSIFCHNNIEKKHLNIYRFNSIAPDSDLEDKE